MLSFDEHTCGCAHNGWRALLGQRHPHSLLQLNFACGLIKQALTRAVNAENQ